MSKGLIVCLIAGIGALALPAAIRADNGGTTVTQNPDGTITITGGLSAGPGQIKDTHITFQADANGNVTTQPAANAPATQPAADGGNATTQPAANAGGPKATQWVHVTITNLQIQTASTPAPPAPATQPAGDNGSSK